MRADAALQHGRNRWFSAVFRVFLAGSAIAPAARFSARRIRAAGLPDPRRRRALLPARRPKLSAVRTKPLAMANSFPLWQQKPARLPVFIERVYQWESLHNPPLLAGSAN
jgi:hypothetical protein